MRFCFNIPSTSTRDREGKTSHREGVGVSRRKERVGVVHGTLRLGVDVKFPDDPVVRDAVNVGARLRLFLLFGKKKSRGGRVVHLREKRVELSFFADLFPSLSFRPHRT